MPGPVPGPGVQSQYYLQAAATEPTDTTLQGVEEGVVEQEVEVEVPSHPTVEGEGVVEEEGVGEGVEVGNMAAGTEVPPPGSKTEVTVMMITTIMKNIMDVLTGTAR